MKGTSKGMKRGTFKSAVNRKNIQESILAILSKSEKPLSTTELSSHLDKSWHTVIRYCLDLEIQGKVFKFSLGRVSAWQIKR